MRLKVYIFTLVLLQCLVNQELQAQTYWQQEVDYLIQVELDDSANTLSGHIVMHYTNHSPDALHFIYIHLMPNAYGSKRSALNNQLLAHDEQSLQFANAIYKGSIDSLNWKVDGISIESKACQDTADIEILELPTPLYPGQTIRLETPFLIKLPSTHISRIGYKDDAYYLTQWYPKPAVYDAYGWHPMSYLDKGEFFSEFGNYEVHITVPQRYVVAASGELLTLEETLCLDTLASFTQTYVHPKKRRFQRRELEPSRKTKTLVYRINNVHDFAFCADPDLLLIKDTMQVDDHPVILQTFVKREHLIYWKNASQYLREAIEFFSDEVAPYPYQVFSQVDVDDITGGDTEYPTISWINHSYSIEEPIVQQVGHNWFYGIIATNERDEHWMDEGLNTFYESLYFTRKYPENKIHYYANMLDGMKFPYYQQSHTEYYMLARENQDQPTKTTSHLLSKENYWVQAYSKPAAFTWHLYKICGQETFKKIIQEYYHTWKYKHPVNGDMHDVFKKYMGEKTDWFFDQGMVTNEKLNYQIKTVKKSGEELIIEVVNKGEIETPIYIETFNSTQKLNTYSFDPVHNKTNLTIPYSSEIQWIAIDHEMSIPDVDLNNNYVRIRNGKKVAKPIRFNYFTSFENPYRRHIYFLQGISFNLYDGLQAGMILHNYGLLPKRTEWFILPQIGCGSLRPNFWGSISHTHFFKKNKSDRMVFKTFTTTQTYRISSGTPLWYFQLSPQLKFVFERRNIYSPLIHELGIKNQLIVQQVDPSLLLNSRWKFLMQNLVYYKVHFRKRLWDVQNTVSLEHAYDFNINYTIAPLSGFTPAVKLFNELKVTWTYFKEKATIQLRIFAGTFLTDPSMVTDTRFRLSGWNGPWDYAFNEYYIGRSESSGFLSQQVSHRDGDFKVNTFVGQTNRWMLTANLEWDVPMIYAGAYIDIGTYSGAGSYPGSQVLAYNWGIYLRTPDRTFQIYFPIMASSDIKQSVDLNTTTYWERIRFTLQLQNFDFIKSIRRLFI